MRKCVILTMDTLEDFVAYDNLLDKPLARLGWNAEHVSWRNPDVIWSDYEAVIIRSTWDYQEDADLFMRVLKNIEESGVLLLNSYAIAQWNINKNYLREVESKGSETIPTIWKENFDYDEIAGYFKSLATLQIVIKPTISANSDNTFWLKAESYTEKEKELKECLKDRQLMIQPFVPAIIEKGEYSLFYFSGEYSHCILKTPKIGDFRVQEEHGGILQSIEPGEKLLNAGKAALNTIPEKVLYARVDLVEFMGAYKVMEIELIEPSLYFNLDDTAAERFALAFDNWMSVSHSL